MLKIDQSQLVMQVILAFITLMIVIIYDLIINICIKIIQLARFLLKEYSLILLDECFSAFDEVTKKTVISELKKRSKNSIIIIISHDPEIIKGCDKTLFILKKIRIR